MPKLIRWLDDVDREDSNRVGDRVVTLAELKKAQLPVQNSFVITSESFHQFLDLAGLNKKISDLISTTKKPSSELRDEAARLICKAVNSTDIPDSILKEIKRNVKRIKDGKSILLEVLPESISKEVTTATQRENKKIVGNEKQLIEEVKNLWLLPFQLPKAGGWFGLDKECRGDVAITVQKHTPHDVSGKLFTIDTKHADNQIQIIQAVWGDWNPTSDSTIPADTYEIDKNGLEIVFKHIVTQDTQLITVDGRTKEVAVSETFKSQQKISDNQLLTLAKIGKKVENHYGFPQEIDWAIKNNEIVILNSSYTHPKIDPAQEVVRSLEEKLPVILRGSPAFPGIATGIPKVIETKKQLSRVRPGDIIVAAMTNPDFTQAIKKSAAIITNQNGLNSHAVSISRKLGIPCVVGTKNATDLLETLRSPITVNGSSGWVFKGGLNPKSRSGISHQNFPKKEKNNTPTPTKTATKIFVTMGETPLAQEVANKTVDGIGLLKSEFIFLEQGVHPKELIAEKKKDRFIKKLAGGIELFASAFDPRPVIYKTSDLHSDEYKNLKGGQKYETTENNPLLGFRGGRRYLENPDEFQLELEAIKLVRNKLGFKNIWFMIPFVRSVEEMENIKRLVSAAGLHRSSTFRLILLAQVPSNIILVDKYLDSGIDGVSIDLDALGTLLLGRDKSNLKISKSFDELDSAVLWSLEKAIKECNKRNLYSGVCGQTPYIYPELTNKLVEWGVSSISVSPQTAEKTRSIVAEAEKKLLSSRKKG